MKFIDTHCHIDGEEFADDREMVIRRAREAGVCRVLVPAIDFNTSLRILELCAQHPHFLSPMAGLHPEEVRADWQQQTEAIRRLLPQLIEAGGVAIGEVGLDYYWSREFEHEQQEAFECQVKWSVETRLPLMIHCRKAQNEMVAILRRYERELPGGVFHCFTGNAHEAEELLRFERFMLGIGGVLTFKKSNLPATLAEAVPLDRIVLETDAPYMAPVPHRGQRNEPAFVAEVLHRLEQVYNIGADDIAQRTTANATKVLAPLRPPMGEELGQIEQLNM